MSRARDEQRRRSAAERERSRQSSHYRALRARLARREQRKGMPDAEETLPATSLVDAQDGSTAGAAAAAVEREPESPAEQTVVLEPDVEQTLVLDAVVDHEPAHVPARASFLAATVVAEPDVPSAAEPAPEPTPAPAPEPAPAPAPAPEPTPAPDEADSTSTSSFAVAMGAQPPRKRRRWPLVAAALGLIAVYIGAAFFLANRVPEGTTVAGIPVGQTEAEARAALNQYAATAEATPITVTAGEQSATVDPAGSLAVDVDATLDELTGFTLAPGELWARATGGTADVDPVLDIDQEALDAAVAEAADELNADPQDASVTVDGGEAVAHPGSQSVVVDPEATTETILAAWPVDNVEATAEVTDPAVTTDEAEALAASLNGHAFAGSTVLTGPNGDVTVTGEQLAAYSAVVNEDGALVWSVDGPALTEAIEQAHPKINNKAVDAAFKFDGKHNLTVTEGVPGRQLDEEKLGAVIEAAAGTTERTGELPYVEVKPDVTAEELPTQDFTARVSQFRTPLTPEPIRTKNLVRAAELVTGTVVKPGERFDLTKTLEPINRANGFYDAHVIVNGRLTNGMGGGLSQMATTTYNAGYFAGMKDIAHRPHSVWFTRYPAGRESTIMTGSINVVFENTTPYALMMSSYVSGGWLYVDIWSTPYYTVTTSASPKTNVVQPDWVTYSDAKCEPKSKGQPGFTITNTRKIYLGDELVDTNKYTWTYRPDHGVRCEAPDS